MDDVLVIGYGNDLRSDDGAGRWVADRVEGLGLRGVEVRSVSQLTPELTMAIAGRRLVVFVDASVEAGELALDDVEVGGDASDVGGSVMTHHGDPRSLLSLVDTVGDRPGRVVVVSIPASNLEMGFELSEATRTAAEAAVVAIADLIGTTP